MRWEPPPSSWVEPLVGQGIPSTVQLESEDGGPLPASVGVGGVHDVLLEHSVSDPSRNRVGQVGATSTDASSESEQPAGAVHVRLCAPGPAIEGVQVQLLSGFAVTPVPVHCAPGDGLGKAMALSVEQDVQPLRSKDSGWMITSMVSLHPLTE